MIVDASDDPAFHADLEAKLLENLRATSVQGGNSRIEVAVQDADGARVAGLAATTSYGWLRVNMLWVSDAHRRTGLGRQLMQSAIEQSLERGCHAAWLETSSPQARTFYTNLGFEGFAKLTNSTGADPVGHTRWFLRRKLISS